MNRKAELSKLIRVQVDIPNSSQIDKDWKLDVKKSSATLPESLRKYLKKTVENLSIRSKRTFTKRAKVENLHDGLWPRKETDEGIVTYEINQENDYIKKLINNNPEIKQLLTILALTLPYDSIYADRADGSEINKNLVDLQEFERCLESFPPELSEKLRRVYYET